MLTCTPAAAAKILHKLPHCAREIALRVVAKTTPTGGLAYALNFCQQVREDDVSIVSNGVTLVVRKQDALFLQGAVLDYMDGAEGCGFRFAEEPRMLPCQAHTYA